MVKVAELAPAATVTLAGVVAIDGAVLFKVTFAPPVGAGADSVTVAVTGVPPLTVVGASVSVDSVAGAAGGGFTTKVVVFCTPLYVAVSDVAVTAETAVVVMPKVAPEAPAAIVTDAGTVTTLLVLDSETDTGEAVAALSAIDPVAELPPTT